MTNYGDMAGVATGPILVSLLTISTVLGCGQLPQGLERNVIFNVTGFSLPVAMVYTDVLAVRIRFPAVLQNRQAATTFVTSLIMESVVDVLEQEGRSAGLLPGVISLILQQLTVQINYDPLKCDDAFVDPTAANQSLDRRINETIPFLNGPVAVQMMRESCIFIGNTVTAVCNRLMTPCQLTMAMRVLPIPTQHLTISGSIRIANPIMAAWSREMWQSILNRVARNLESGPFGANFISASVTVG